MWLTLAFTSAALLGFYDAAKKKALTGNAVLPVLLLNTLFSTLFFLPAILSAEFGLGWFDHTLLATAPGTWEAHALVVLKSAIVLTSWIFGYFGMKHLPITIVGPINATRPVMVLVGAFVIFGERLNAYQWTGVVLALVSLFLLSLTRGYYPYLIEPSAFTVSRCVVALGLVLVAVAVMVAAWVSPRDAAFGELCYWLLIASVLVVLVLALLKVNATVMGDVSSVLFGLTCICLWALLCRMSFKSGADAVRVVGLGFGAACLGSTAGVGVGSLIYEMGMPEGLLSFVMAAAIILCVAGSLFLLRCDDIVRLMAPVKAQEPTTAGVGAESSRATDAESAGALDASALDGYQASLQRLCAILGIDFGLSAREVDVLELLVLGKDAKAIADELFISFNTVRSHIRRIYGKLDVHSRQELLDKVRGQAE